MVSIEIYDLHSNVDKPLLNEITYREIKAVEGGVVERRDPYGIYTNDRANTDNTSSNNTSISSTLQQVNGLLDNLRFELDKIFGRL